MSKPILADFHMHTEHSPDSEASMCSMLDAAVQAGLSCCAITDHVEISAYFHDGYNKTLRASYEQASALQKQYNGRLRVARGVELGEPLQDLPSAELVLNSYAFDFILGSLHNLKDEEDFYYYDYAGVDVLPLLDRYFEEVLDMAEWGRFHSLAHLTYPFRYFPDDKRPADYRRWEDIIEEILKTLVLKSIALEINTSGLRQAIGKTLPDLPIVRRYRELGGEAITLGSDAHRPADVAANITDGLRLAGQAGFRYTTVFYDGKPEWLPISL